MRGPTCIFWANLTPFSLKYKLALAVARPEMAPQLEAFRAWVSEHWFPRQHLPVVPCLPTQGGHGRRRLHNGMTPVSARVISDRHFAVQLNHFIPGFLSYSVAVLSKVAIGYNPR
jgi:hypothetical protein